VALTPGTRIGSYEVGAQIGVGGMGEVYRATDLNLKRQVAIKVLPDAVATDAERLARFQREAEVLAALNHPNIAGIHGLERSDRATALVMELVDGPTLADRIAQGPIPVDEALAIARQIAEALEAAHERGIIHRDLKPANIKLRPDGTVKVLDFGLAKAMEPTGAMSANQSMSPTITTPAMTEAGIILGTAAYMSPEQARGQAVDKRSDIWAFGAVLWELITGKGLFTGPTVTDVLAAVVKTEPDWSVLPSSTPAPIRTLFRRCLAKDRKRRLPDIGVARLEIDEVLAAPVREGEDASGLTKAGPARGVQARLLSWAAAAVLAVALATVWWTSSGAPAGTWWTGVRLGGPEVAYHPRISPDGQLLAFLAMVDGITQVAVMKPGTGNYQVLTKDRSKGLVNTISWSPNSDRLYFDRFAGVPNGVYSVPVLGGDERLVVEDAAGPQVLPDGSVILVRLDTARRMRINRYWPAEDRFQPLAVLAGRFSVARLRFRAASAANVVVFYGTPLDAPDAPDRLYTMDLDTGRVQAIGLDLDEDIYGLPPGLAVTPDGKSVLFPLPSGDLQQIVSVATDGSGTRRLLFTVTQLVNTVEVGPDGSVYVDQFNRPGEVLRIPPSGAAPERLGYLTPVITAANGRSLPLPDGRVVVNARNRGQPQLIVMGTGREPVPLLDTAEATDAPMALVDGDRMAFMIGLRTERTIALASIEDGRLLGRLKGTEAAEVDSIAVSPDGQTIYYAASGSVWAVPVSDGPPQELRPGDSVTVDPYRNDLIVQLNETEGVRLLRVPLDGSPETLIPVEDGQRISAGSGLHPNAVARDGKILVQVAPASSFFFPAGLLDPSTGKVETIRVEDDFDMPAPGWTAEGDVLVTAFRMRSSLWRFRPEDSEQ